MSNVTQRDRYKRRYERVVKQLSALLGSDVTLRDVRFVVVPRPDGTIYRAEVRALGSSSEYEDVVFVRRNSAYPEDAMAVIGQEVRKRLRDRIRNTRAALR